jgi:transposase
VRSLFVAGALAVIRYAKIHGTEHRPWLTALMVWVLMARGERYKEPIALAAQTRSRRTSGVMLRLGRANST